MWETWVQSLGREDHLKKGTATNSVFLPGEFLEQRSLAGYSPRDHKESDMTEEFSLLPHTVCKILEKAMAAHSSTLAWRIPWTEEPGGLLSMGR